MASGSATHLLKICAPAAKEQLPVIRAAVAATAAVAQFDLDDINDLRLAIDEACSQLLKYATETSTLECSIEKRATDPLRITVGLWPVSRTPVQERTFGWHVIEMLTDSVELTTTDALSPDNEIPAIVFTKRCALSAVPR